MFTRDLLSKKVVLVTGGGTGLGKAMASRAGDLGARLVLASRNPAHLDAAATEFRARGIDVLAHPCDVRDPVAVDAMVAAAVDKYGRIDALINNAAGNFLCPTEDVTPNGFDAVVRIVMHGTFFATQAVGKRMMAQGGGGSILSIVATYVETGSAFVVPSAMAKSGVLAMTRSLAVEWARHGIRLNAIAPGPFPTEGAWSRLVPAGIPDEEMTKNIPARRFGRPEELADLACYLLADGASYVTGDCITIDGGRSLMAGEFNEYTRHDPTAVRQMMAAMRPRKG